MARKPFMPTTVPGIGIMLNKFAATASDPSNGIATKYNITSTDIARVVQASLVWGWFEAALAAARSWAQSLTSDRDSMTSGPVSTPVALPGGPTLPPAPKVGPAPGTPVQLEPGFFTFFSGLATGIKDETFYEVADGLLLGIEGVEIPPPNAATTVPPLHGEIFTGGHPELSCVKSIFQGYDVYLTRPGQAKKLLGFSTARRYNVTEPLPAAGTAEVWIFEVQYHYQNAPFGQMSPPLSLTVRG